MICKRFGRSAKPTVDPERNCLAGDHVSHFSRFQDATELLKNPVDTIVISAASLSPQRRPKLLLLGGEVRNEAVEDVRLLRAQEFSFEKAP
jgi:hypothetical protein